MIDMKDIFDSLGYFILMVVVLGIQIPIVIGGETSTRLLSGAAVVMLTFSILHHPIIGVI